MSTNPFDDENGTFYVLVQRRGAAQPVADVRRRARRLAGGVRGEHPGRLPGLRRGDLDRPAAQEPARRDVLSRQRPATRSAIRAIGELVFRPRDSDMSAVR